ncbi:MAG: CvpA family protein [Boseongicola sp.]|nr:MAG: CvpA family protein [Boseongicola sp.]
MEAFTILDGIVAVIIILSSVLAYSRGFVRETLAIGGWILAAIVAFVFAPTVEPLMKEVPVLRDFIAGSCDLAMIGAFAVVFAVALIIVSVFTPLFAGAVQRSALGGIDQGFGFLFGAARGILLVVIGMMIYEQVIVNDPIAVIDESRTAAVYNQVSDTIMDQIPEDPQTWVMARYEDLMGQCSEAAET